MIIPVGDDNPSSRTPYATYVLMALNVFAFFILNWARDFPLGGLGMGDAREWGLVPFRLNRDGLSAAHTLLTSTFVHGDILHLGGNMLFLWIAGDNVEDKLGTVKFVLFYLASGVLASATYLLYAGLMSTTPLVGASGAIAGVLGCYMIFFPKARIRVFYWFYFFIGTFHVEARWALGFWIVENILMWQLMPSSYVTGVAYAAHVGGFVVGVAVALLVKRRIVSAAGVSRADRLTGFARRTDERTREDPKPQRKPQARSRPATIQGTARVGAEFVSPRVETQRGDKDFFGIEEAIAANVQNSRLDSALDRYGDYLRMPHAKPLPAWAQIEIAAEFYRRGDYEEALKAYRRYLAHYPAGADSPEAKFRLGIILSRHRNEYFRAREYLLQASMEHPDTSIVALAKKELDRIKPLV